MRIINTSGDKIGMALHGIKTRGGMALHGKIREGSARWCTSLISKVLLPEAVWPQAVCCCLQTCICGFIIKVMVYQV